MLGSGVVAGVNLLPRVVACEPTQSLCYLLCWGKQSVVLSTPTQQILTKRDR